MDKNQIKSCLAEEVQKESNKYEHSKVFLKFWRRVDTICRSQINRLSYQLKCEGTKIYLVRGDRERIIECKSHDGYWSEKAFTEATKLLDSLKSKFSEKEITMS